MGNRRNAFVADASEASPAAAQYVVLVDAGIQRGSTRVREGETFSADPREVAALVSKGYVAIVSIATAVPRDEPVTEPESETVMNLELSE